MDRQLTRIVVTDKETGLVVEDIEGVSIVDMAFCDPLNSFDSPKIKLSYKDRQPARSLLVVHAVYYAINYYDLSKFKVEFS